LTILQDAQMLFDEQEAQFWTLHDMHELFDVRENPGRQAEHVLAV
jgi:hypothetical protein